MCVCEQKQNLVGTKMAEKRRNLTPSLPQPNRIFPCRTPELSREPVSQ